MKLKLKLTIFAFMLAFGMKTIAAQTESDGFLKLNQKNMFSLSDREFFLTVF